MAINWTEVLASRGVDTDALLAGVKAEEARVQGEQRAFHEERKLKHEPAKHGLGREKVAAYVKRSLTDAQFEFCGAEYVSEVWDAL